MADGPTGLSDGTPARPAAGAVVAVVVVLVVCVAGVVAYLTSPAHRLHDPVHALQQFDLFFLDEPAPLAGRLGLQPGRPALVVVCAECRAPEVNAQVRVTDEVDVARRYGLLTADGRVGPGYAVVDASGALRYRTFDPAPAAHVEEIDVLLDNAR
ncbi:hypothetical protein [Euzebya pacifica]|jgi:hypothetical protein|uniref:hypothetical protein n=1 Tax=Euzebya pacifica TaxID=1608957 RepID=UPI0030FBFAE5